MSVAIARHRLVVELTAEDPSDDELDAAVDCLVRLLAPAALDALEPVVTARGCTVAIALRIAASTRADADETARGIQLDAARALREAGLECFSTRRHRRARGGAIG